MTTALTVIALPGAWATAPAALTFTTTDGSATFLCDGLTFLLAQNSSGAADYTITITSIADASSGRTTDITADSILRNTLRVYQVFPPGGWKNSSGLVGVAVSNTAVKLAACRISPGGSFAGVQ